MSKRAKKPTKDVKLEPLKAVKFVDMSGVEHDATTADVLLDADRIDLGYTYKGMTNFEFDVPKQTIKSKRHYWRMVSRQGE